MKNNVLIGRIKSWRYNCPLCESQDIYKNVIKQGDAKQYYCCGCNTGITKIYDKKQQQKVNA